MTAFSLRRAASAALLPVSIGILSDSLSNPSVGSPTAQTARAALESFALAEGLEIELVASEPLVFDPVAVAFDERRRMYVAENRGYPTGPGEGNPPAGSIALLEDEDNDGRYDRRTVFAEGLNFPNGVLPSRGGVYVTDAPDLLFLKDTDGDGRADVRKVVLTGFSEGGSTQLRVSHPTFGPEGWIYMTNGLSGGTVRNPNLPDAPPVENRGGDWKFDPKTGIVLGTAGQAQFGLAFDDLGRRFVCSNRKPIEHIVLEPEYLARNPRFAWTEMVQTISGGQDTPAPLFPISANVTTADSHAGTFTAACGLTLFRGTALPEEYDGQCFVCDPTGNLVHCDRLLPDGATFQIQPVDGRKEFLASTDTWFRPVNLANGPDGALYLCDMYRKTIEHPVYLPQEIAAVTDFDSGKDQGRIYRILSREKRKPRSQILEVASKETLIQSLDHPDGWVRDTASRLLMESEEKWQASELHQRFREAKTAKGRFQVLSTLGATDRLNVPTLSRALSDPDSGVREAALRWAERSLKNSPSLVEEVLPLAEDPDPQVRFRCALALGEIRERRALEVLARIAERDGGDRWTVAAILTSVAGRENDLFYRLTEDAFWVARIDPELLRNLSKLIVSSASREIAIGCFRKAAEMDLAPPNRNPAQIGSLLGFWEGFGKGRDSYLATVISADKTLLEEYTRLLDRVSRLTSQDEISTPERERSARLLGYWETEAGREVLESLVHPYAPKELQIAAVESLVALPGSDLDRLLFDRNVWEKLTPSVRDSALSAVVNLPHRVPALLSALENGSILTNEVNPTIKTRLLNQSDPDIKDRAQNLLGSVRDEDRKRVYEEFKSVLGLQADSSNGREVFKKTCAQCHRLDGEGYEVGPDLYTVRDKTKETLLLQILIPNQEMVPGFTNYLIETVEGETLTGIIAAESPTSLTLKWSGGEQVTLLREDIEAMRSTQLSLMPQDLENSLTKQEMADLLAYLKGEGIRKGE